MCGGDYNILTVESDGCASSDPWKDGKHDAVHLTECANDCCARCDWLIDGFYMSCDQCGHWGQQDCDGWTLCCGMPFCSDKCRDAYFGCDASLFSETDTLPSLHNNHYC